MPHLNSRGDVAHGVGGGFASLNNVRFSRGAVFGWLDDDTIVLADGADAYIVSTYHVSTKTIARLGTTGANSGFAGGGHAAWWLGASDGTRGLSSTTGLRLPDAGLMGMGPDGAICYKPDYQSNGPTRVRELDGADWLLTDGHADYVSLQGQGRALWMEGLRPHAHGQMPDPLAAAGSIWKAEAIWCAGAWWICYYSEVRGIVLHPFDSLVGFSHLPTGDGWHTARAIGEGVIRVATATGQGEQAGEIWARDYDVVLNLVRDPWGDGLWRPVARVDIESINAVPVPVEHSPATIPVLPRFSHPMKVGYYYRDTSAIQYGGDNPAAPCNVSVIIDPLALPAEDYAGKPVNMITSVACLTDLVTHPEWWPRWDAIYLGVEGDAALLERMAKAVRQFASALGLPVKPFLTYTAGYLYQNALTPADIIGVQLYFDGNQGPADVRALAASALPKVAHRRVALICQAYDRAGLYTGDLAALQPVYAEIAEQWRNVEYLILFSDGRKGGTRDHENIRPWHHAMLAACG